ncbi:MAG: DUF1772 domain-containing protein [candidate division Zixibacteria bacterium]|nr:DUF1772 domain-containing protein [candidate division Zixibacteria bacterium]
MKEFMEILTFAVALGSALVAGVFFAFSTFVMRALGQLPESQGIAAMKAINVTVINPWFFLAFFGTGVLCLIVALLALGSTAGTHRAYLLAGCALYLLGCLLVTVAFNVPLNDQLASADPDSSGAAALWANYLSRWTFWNHVRTAASLAAAGFFTMAFRGVN